MNEIENLQNQIDELKNLVEERTMFSAEEAQELLESVGR